MVPTIGAQLITRHGVCRTIGIQINDRGGINSRRHPFELVVKQWNNGRDEGLKGRGTREQGESNGFTILAITATWIRGIAQTQRRSTNKTTLENLMSKNFMNR